MKLPYSEGTWFAVPLRDEGFCCGIVTRSTKKGGVILCYFFGPRLLAIPSLLDVDHLSPDKALKIIRVGDLGLINGKWSIIGQSKSWDRTRWPIPIFIRKELFTERSWKVYYSDQDPNKVVKEEPVSYDNIQYDNDSMHGYGAAEILLTEIIRRNSL